MKTERILSRDIIILMAASFFYMASPMLVNPIIAGFTESLGASAAIMGMVGGFTNLCALIFQPIAGNMTDKINKKLLGTLGTCCLITAAAGYVIAQNPGTVLFFRVINGLGFSCCSVCFSTWISGLLPKEKIGFGMGIYGMTNALAMAVSPSIGVAVYKRLGYRPALAVAALFAVLSCICVRTVKDSGMPVRVSGGASKRFRILEKRVIPIALVIMCFTIPYSATQSFIVRYTEKLSLNVGVEWFFTIYAVALLVLRTAFRNIFDRVSFISFTYISTVSALLSLLLLFKMTGNLMMVPAAILMAGGYGIMCTVAQSAAVLKVNPEERGIANSTYYIGLNSGMALGPFIGGVLYGNLDLKYFYPVFMSAAILGLVLYYVSAAVLKTETK